MRSDRRVRLHDQRSATPWLAPVGHRSIRSSHHCLNLVADAGNGPTSRSTSSKVSSTGASEALHRYSNSGSYFATIHRMSATEQRFDGYPSWQQCRRQATAPPLSKAALSSAVGPRWPYGKTHLNVLRSRRLHQQSGPHPHRLSPRHSKIRPETAHNRYSDATTATNRLTMEPLRREAPAPGALGDLSGVPRMGRGIRSRAPLPARRIQPVAGGSGGGRETRSRSAPPRSSA